MLPIVSLNYGLRIGCEQMMPLKKYCKLMRISKFSLAKCSWCGMETTICKHDCLLLIEIIHMIRFGIMLLKILFWTSRKILQPCWQLYMKSIDNWFILLFLFVRFIWFSLAYHWLFYFIMRNQKFYVCINLVISFSAFKTLLANHFHILKNLSPKKILLPVMPNKNPNIGFGSL